MKPSADAGVGGGKGRSRHVHRLQSGIEIARADFALTLCEDRYSKGLDGLAI